MGKPVTVDSDDLEVLLLSSAAGRKIEDILSAIGEDPAVLRIKKTGRIGEALDRVNRQRAQAMKENGGEFEPLTTAEITLLRQLSSASPIGVQAKHQGFHQALRRNGLVVIGQSNEVVLWGDKSETAQEMPYQRVRITDAGRTYLKEHDNG